MCAECAAAGMAPALGSGVEPGLSPSLAGTRRVPPGDLTPLLAGAQPGTRFVLGPGRYVLNGPVRLGHGMVVEGAGCGETRVVAIAGARVHVHLQDESESVLFQDLTFAQAQPGELAPVPATEVLRATSGHVSLLRCRLEGGAGGLWVGRTARVEAEACVFEGSSGAGMLVTDAARVALSSCELAAHAGFGLQVGHRARVEARAIAACRNARGGLAVEAWGELSVYDSTIAGNDRRGVVVRSLGPCELRRNTIEHNAGPGIEAGRAPGLALEANRIRANQGAGVMLGEGARVEASANACEENAQDGFAVYKGAWARLVGNGAHRNGRFGVWVGSGGEAALADNQAGDNEGGAFMAAWTAAIAPESAASFGRRSDQSSRGAREHLRPGGRFGRR